jgi:threonine dehydratase
MAASANGMPVLRDVYAARQRIRGLAIETPLVPSALSARAGCEVLLKLECFQPIGAFKIRGAANAVAGLADEARAQGVACCSTGNHGRAVAFAAKAAGVKAIVCLSELVPAVKADAIAALGAEVRRVGRSQDEAQVEVDRLVAEEGMTDIPPFDHPAVIAGQGTIALELFEARPDLKAIVVPLSGGGLMAGIALAAKAISPAVRMVGVSMDRGAAMAESLAAGRPVEVEEVASLADSLGGGIGLANCWTFALCRDLVDETILVSEEEIYRGMQALFRDDRLVAEGGSAVSHAALLAGKLKLGGPAAFIISGRNVDMNQFSKIVAGQPVQLGDRTVQG